MKYILMMASTQPGFDEYSRWSKEDAAAHYAYLQRLNKELSAAGEFVTTHGLGWPRDARIVRAGKNGAPVTDGVFPESKEFLAGFWIVDVDSPDRAYEIAARISAGPGPGGTPLSMPIEVRPVMSGPPDELL